MGITTNHMFKHINDSSTKGDTFKKIEVIVEDLVIDALNNSERYVEAKRYIDRDTEGEGGFPSVTSGAIREAAHKLLLKVVMNSNIDKTVDYTSLIRTTDDEL